MAASRRALIAQVAAGERVQEMRLDPGEVGMNRSGAVEDGLELAAGGGRILLGHADHCGRVADLADGGMPVVEGGESRPRLVDHPAAGPGWLSSRRSRGWSARAHAP